jgi:hypothetical protein
VSPQVGRVGQPVSGHALDIGPLEGGDLTSEPVALGLDFAQCGPPVGVLAAQLGDLGGLTLGALLSATARCSYSTATP